jgi:hypothetical protein
MHVCRIHGLTHGTLRDSKGIRLGGDRYSHRLRLHLKGCDITSQSIACVGIRGGADPRLLRNRIHDGKMLASMWTTTARGTLEDNDIFGNAFSAVEIKME